MGLIAPMDAVVNPTDIIQSYLKGAKANGRYVLLCSKQLFGFKKVNPLY